MEMNIRMLMTRSGNTRGSLVILSAAKDLALGKEMLRGVSPERSAWAQHDTTGFASLQCIIGLGGCSAPLMKSDKACMGFLCQGKPKKITDQNERYMSASCTISIRLAVRADDACSSIPIIGLNSEKA